MIALTEKWAGIFLAVMVPIVPMAAADFPDDAEKQEWERVESRLLAKSDVNAAQSDGTTALHWAAYHDRGDIVEKLLAAGAAADRSNRYGITPLLIACQNGNEAIVEALLVAGANVNASQRGGETALMIAARTGKSGAVQVLLDHGAKVDASENHGQTALMWAATEGHAAVVSLLLQQGADLKCRLKSGFTALLFAAREGKSAVVDTLLKAGADPRDAIATAEAPGGRGAPDGVSAVDLAIENGYFELALTLVQAGADPNDQRSGFAPLHRLTWVRKPPRGDDEAGQPPPETHGKLTSLDCLRALVAAGAAVDAPLPERAKARAFGSINFSGATPFLLACRNADLPMMKLLVALGADPQRPNADGSTPLMAAAGLGCYAPDEEAGTEEECLEACRYLLSLGADVNAVDRNGQTAMHGAAYKSLPKVVQFLADRGAAINVWNRKNSKGWTPLLIAQGFRPGNFKPSAETIAAISGIMIANGIDPPPPPERDAEPKKKGYDP